MKHLKMLGLAAIAAGALMAFVGAGTASATELTCTEPAGTKVMCKEPTHIHAEVEGKVILHPPIGDIECSEGTVTGNASTGSSTTTPSGVIETLTFGSCNAEVVVLEAGSLEIHTKLNEKGEPVPNNGTLTSSGAKVTVTFIGFHCIFSTSNTDIGTLTGSSSVPKTKMENGEETPGTPTLDIEATISRTGGRSGAFCGSTAQWTGNYKVTTPDWMDVD